LIDVELRRAEGRLARIRINVFYLVSSICLSLFIIYIWFAFLPLFEGTLQYESIKNVMIIITIFILISIGIQLISSIER